MTRAERKRIERGEPSPLCNFLLFVASTICVAEATILTIGVVISFTPP